MTQKAPGKSHRKGITVVELADMFPDEAAAQRWFESKLWPAGRHCPKCGSTSTHHASHNMPYWCTGCRGYFSVKTGTAMESSKLPLRKWAFAIYMHLVNLKGVSSMKLHRDISVTQKTAWFMLQRIRKAWDSDDWPFGGPVEVDETFIGGRDRNKHANKKPRAGRGPVSKAARTLPRAMSKSSSSGLRSTRRWLARARWNTHCRSMQTQGRTARHKAGLRAGRSPTRLAFWMWFGTPGHMA